MATHVDHDLMVFLRDFRKRKRIFSCNVNILSCCNAVCQILLADNLACSRILLEAIAILLLQLMSNQLSFDPYKYKSVDAQPFVISLDLELELDWVKLH